MHCWPGKACLLFVRAFFQDVEELSAAMQHVPHLRIYAAGKLRGRRGQLRGAGRCADGRGSGDHNRGRAAGKAGGCPSRMLRHPVQAHGPVLQANSRSSQSSRQAKPHACGRAWSRTGLLALLPRTLEPSRLLGEAEKGARAPRGGMMCRAAKHRFVASAIFIVWYFRIHLQAEAEFGRALCSWHAQNWAQCQEIDWVASVRRVRLRCRESNGVRLNLEVRQATGQSRLLPNAGMAVPMIE